jgi:hypothetical protein
MFDALSDSFKSFQSGGIRGFKKSHQSLTYSLRSLYHRPQRSIHSRSSWKLDRILGGVLHFREPEIQILLHLRWFAAYYCWTGELLEYRFHAYSILKG